MHKMCAIAALPIKDRHINAHKCGNKCHAKIAKCPRSSIFDCNYVIGRDGIYDNALNILEKFARNASRMLRKHGITILTIVQHNRNITNAGH